MHEPRNYFGSQHFISQCGQQSAWQVLGATGAEAFGQVVADAAPATSVAASIDAKNNVFMVGLLMVARPRAYSKRAKVSNGGSVGVSVFMAAMRLHSAIKIVCLVHVAEALDFRLYGCVFNLKIIMQLLVNGPDNGGAFLQAARRR